MEKDGTFELKDNLRDTISDSRHIASSFSNRKNSPKSDHYENIRTVDDEEEDKEHHAVHHAHQNEGLDQDCYS
jgi:hypothetical protein